jgi:peptidoglycan/xylan/chitin deacetylase (PgdA/CDA1 family)
MTDVVVLCYHALSPTWNAAMSTTPERFERQIATLVRHGYRGVTFAEAVGAASGARMMAITFDDAYRSVLELAQPILERYGVVASVFAPTDFIGSERPMRWPGIERWHGGPHERELTPMSWAELRGLVTTGWEVGSHTASHPHLTQLEPAALADELVRSKAACEQQLASPCTSIAYPYGDVDRSVVAAAARAGYSAGAALPARTDSRDALRWPRIGIYRVDDDLRFRLKVSPLVRRLRGSVAWDSVDTLRRAVQRV